MTMQLMAAVVFGVALWLAVFAAHHPRDRAACQERRRARRLRRDGRRLDRTRKLPR